MKAVAFVAALMVSSGCRGDACERALDRIERIDAKKSIRPPSAASREQALDACRHEKYAAYDPVLRCAMDSDSDDAAAACIDAFVHAVVKPGAPAGSGSDVGRGLNPLLDDTR